MTPVTFDGHFGWFHAGDRRRGAILCPAFGPEALWAGASWRLLADAIAGAGVPALRFDYLGTGDSLGDPGDPQRVEAWLRGIRDAVAWMRANGDVDEIALVGLRLGGFLAARVAAEIGDVESLVLLAPSGSGRGFVREMQAQARVLGRLPDGRPAAPDDPTSLNVAGFPLSAETAAALRALDAPRNATAVASRVFLALPQGSPGGEALASALAGDTATLEIADFPGFPEIISNPIAAMPPHALYARIGAFLASGAPARGRGARLPRCLGLPRFAPALLQGDGFAERPLAFAGLNGVACRPALPTGTDLAVVFVNAGLNPRAGWARGSTTLARRLAARGIPSLRFDLAGIGDSPARPGAGLPLFDPAREADVRAAIDALAGEGVRRVVLVGACSGSYLNLQVALADARVAGAVLVNMPRFFWAAGASIAAALRDPYRPAASYLGIARSGTAWRRVLRGEVDLAGILRALATRAATQAGRAAREVLAGRESVRRRSNRAMRSLASREARLVFAYSEADSGLTECIRLFGPGGRRISRRYGFPVAILPDADHDLTPRAAREAMFAQVEALARDLAGSPMVERASPLARAA